MTLRTTLLVLFLFTLRPVFAEHLPGGSITSTCLGGNYFEIKLQLMRECSGFPMIAQSLHFTNSCGVVFSVSNLQPVLVENPSQLCEAENINSTCSGGTLPGFELYEFTTELFLSPCSFWTIYWSICCRQPSLNVQSIPGLYIETQIDNITEACNNSPLFNHNGVPRVCVGQPVNYDAGATDPDGDRMTFSLIDARRLTNNDPLVVNSVNYVFPYDGSQPFDGMAIDEYGQITFTPTTQGYIIITVKVDEYNANNQWIGSVMRDFPFIVTACTNTIPSANAGMIQSTSGGASAEGDRAVRLCRGNEACITIEFDDPDEGQELSIWSNVGSIIPGAVIETSGTDPLIVNICWSEVLVETGSSFFVTTVMDDDCPTRGARSFVYTVEVAESPYAGMDGQALACAIATPFTLLDSLEGNPPAGGSWTDPQGAFHSGFFDGMVDQPGFYTYTIIEDGCAATALLEIEFLPEQDSLCILMGVTERYRGTHKLFPNPSTGTIIIEGVDGYTGPIDLYDAQGRLVWTATPANVGDVLQLVLPEHLGNGIYTLQGLDRNGRRISSRAMLER